MEDRTAWDGREGEVVLPAASLWRVRGGGAGDGDVQTIVVLVVVNRWSGVMHVYTFIQDSEYEFRASAVGRFCSRH